MFIKMSMFNQIRQVFNSIKSSDVVALKVVVKNHVFAVILLKTRLKP